MKIVITGPKCAGKSAAGCLVAEQLGLPFVETDEVIESIHAERHGQSLSCREIWKSLGEDGFRAMEREAVAQVAEMDWCVISTGGATMLHPDSRRLLRRDSIIVLLTSPIDVLWPRMENLGLPPFFSGDDGKERFAERISRQDEAVLPIAHCVVDSSLGTREETASRVIDGIEREVALRASQPNTFGEVLRVTTFGESHGPAVGAVLDGVPPGIEISQDYIQKELDRRRPGQSAVVTPRDEPDRVHILSGVFEGKTTGTPIALVIYNRDQDSSKYDNLREVYRPGHADFTFWKKYGIRDHRGGGRSSGRETAARVAGGAVARMILEEMGIAVTAYALEVAGIRASVVDYDVIEHNPVRSPDPEAAVRMEKAILDARAGGDSVGGIVQLEVRGVPVGLGDPVFGKLESRLGAAILSLGAIKGIEFGDGFGAARMRGSEHNDEMRDGGFLTNHAGGVLGGISTGEPIIVRAAVKPTPSISGQQTTMDVNGENREIVIEGRHDPCIVPRVIPVIEAMAALVILDALYVQERIRASRGE